MGKLVNGRSDDRYESSSPEIGSAERSVSKGSQSSVDRKMASRRIRWSWDLPLATVSLIAFSAISAIAAASYFYHSTKISATFLSRAEEAVQSSDLNSQQRWLRRYLMLEPNDVDAIIQLAVAADDAVDTADRDDKGKAIDKARQQLGASIARLGEFDDVDSAVQDLRSRLIERLLLLGGPWYVEAERQILLMDADPGDAQVAKWLATSLHGQFLSESYKDRQPHLETDEVDPWTRVSHLPIGEVLAFALKLNPGDLDLLAPYMMRFQSNPELFNQSSESLAEHQVRVDEAVAEMLSQDTGRAQLVLYSYAQQGEGSDRAKEVALAAAPKASERLAEATAEGLGEEKSLTVPDFVWDYRLLAAAAESCEQSDPETAAVWYAQLMETKSAIIGSDLTERVYARAGALSLRNEDVDTALKVWERGLEEVGPGSVRLSGLIADLRLYNEDDSKAGDAVEAFRDAVRLLKRRLSTGQRWDVANRANDLQQLQVATWRLDLADGLLALRQGDEANGVAMLNDAFYSTVTVPVRERIRVGDLLADIAERNRTWDIAAVVLQEAVELEPGNISLRARAAQAWDRAGSRSQAMRIWRTLSQSDSVFAQAASLQAMLENQIRQAPGERDFSGVRSELARLETQMERLGESPPKKNEEEAIKSLLKRLASLRVKLPPPGVTFEKHIKSPGFVESVLSLSRMYPDDAGIQIFVAQQLTVSGSMEKAEAVLARIAEMLGEDSTEYVAVRAGAEFSGGSQIEGSERLEKQAELDPERATKLLRTASLFAKAASDNERSYRLLVKIPDAERSEKDLFELAVLARVLPPDSSFLTLRGQPTSTDELSEYWEEQIRILAGNDNAYAKWLVATNLIDELMEDPNELNSFDPRVRKARQLVNQILKQRPRWGDAISLNGWISAAEKRHTEAIDELRGGIVSGDRRLRTQMLLVQQLLTVGRNGEAEEQLASLPTAAIAVADRYGATRIKISGRRGDFEKVLRIARAGVSENPRDYLRHVILARAAMAVAQRDIEQRDALLSEARSTLEEASDLVGNDEVAVLFAWVQLAVVDSKANGFDGLQKEIARLQQEIDGSAFDENRKCLLRSECFIALREFEKSAEMLLLADKLKPDVRTQLALADVYRKMRDPEGEVTALWEAHRRTPSDAQLRGRLAIALAGNGGSKVDWSDLSGLLEEDESATSANRLLHALLLAEHGDGQQQEKASSILRELISEQNQHSEDASRTLAGLLRKQFERSNESEDTIIGKRYVSEIIKLYSALTQRPQPSTGDLYRFADFLLSLKDGSLLPNVKRLSEQLEASKGGILQSVDIGQRYAERVGLQLSLVEIVENLIEKKNAENGELDVSAALSAGVALINAGFTEEGLEWIDKAYHFDPQNVVRSYAIALSSAKQFDRCIEICRDHYEEFKDPVSITFLAEALMVVPGHVDDAAKLSFEDAISRHNKNAQILESIATLRMLKEDYPGSISLFRMVLDLDPFKIRSLNNLSMACSQVPGREAEGLETINLAIKLAGEQPELLDTKGAVLLKAGRLDEAYELFQQLVAISKEPRYQFHLVLTLLAQSRTREAELAWENLELEKLDPEGLTPAEKRRLEQLKLDFAPQPKKS